MRERRDEFYTITVAPERTGRVRYYVLTRRHLRLLFLSGGLLLLIAGVAGLQMWRSMDRAQEVKELRRQELTLRTQLEGADQRLKEISERLESLDQLEKRLRGLAQLSDPARRIAMGPGQNPSDEESRLWDPGESPLLVRARTQLFSERLNGLLEEADLQVERLDQLAQHFEAVRHRLAATPAVSPLIGWVTSRFGMRQDPMTGRHQMHKGLDIASAMGTPIVSPSDGVIAKVGEQSGYGLVVLIDHGFGIMSSYAHLLDSSVKAGESVKRGQQIGRVGMSGRSTGPHLHYEVRIDGVAVDPEFFILE